MKTDSQQDGAPAGDEKLGLVRPTVELRSSYISGLRQRLEAGEELNLPVGFDFRMMVDDFEGCVRQREREEKGIGLPPGYVRQTTFWLVRGGREVLGEARLRYQLTPELEHEGGHIGYVIFPAHRGKGFGTVALALTLKEAGKAGLKKVLVTCDTDNTPSARIIRKNGGVLHSKGISRRTGKSISRYWIRVPGAQ